MYKKANRKPTFCEKNVLLGKCTEFTLAFLCKLFKTTSSFPFALYLAEARVRGLTGQPPSFQFTVVPTVCLPSSTPPFSISNFSCPLSGALAGALSECPSPLRPPFHSGFRPPPVTLPSRPPQGGRERGEKERRGILRAEVEKDGGRGEERDGLEALERLMGRTVGRRGRKGAAEEKREQKSEKDFESPDGK